MRSISCFLINTVGVAFETIKGAFRVEQNFVISVAFVICVYLSQKNHIFQ